MEGFYPIYATAQSTFGVNWLLIASIHRQESAFSTAPGTYHGLNFARCCGGPMQFNVTNGPVSTWDLVSDSYSYGKRPAAYDHMTATHPSIYDDFDSIMAAAHLLSADGAEYALDGAAWDAAYDYYGHDATGVSYADEVLARAIGWSQHGFCINCGVEARWSKRCTPPTARRCWRRWKPKRSRPTATAQARSHSPRAARRSPRQAAPACASSSPATRSVAPRGAAEQPPRELRAAEVQRRVVLPGGADAAVDGDHRARGLVERPAGDRARGVGGERELRRARRGAPSPRSRAASGRSRAGAAPR